jgi:hypothetical protein
LYIDGLKLLDRNEDDLENEIKIFKAISKDIKYEFWIRKLCKNIFKQDKLQNKIHIRGKVEKDSKELDPTEAC